MPHSFVDPTTFPLRSRRLFCLRFRGWETLPTSRAILSRLRTTPRPSAPRRTLSSKNWKTFDREWSKLRPGRTSRRVQFVQPFDITNSDMLHRKLCLSVCKIIILEPQQSLALSSAVCIICHFQPHCSTKIMRTSKYYLKQD